MVDGDLALICMGAIQGQQANRAQCLPDGKDVFCDSNFESLVDIKEVDIVPNLVLMYTFMKTEKKTNS